MSQYSTGGRDPIDGELYDASFECDDCGLYLSWPVTETADGMRVPASQDPIAAPMLAMIAEHDNGGCHRDAAFHAEALAPRVEFPRDLYFKAEDYLVGPGQPGERELTVIRNQRFNLFRQVSHKAEKFLAAQKSIKDFDSTGNIGQSIRHAADLLDDQVKLYRNLSADIAEAEARYTAAVLADRLPAAYGSPAPAAVPPSDPAVAVEPTPQAPAAANTFPKPGPSAAPVPVFNPSHAPRDVFAAFEPAAVAARIAKAGGAR